MVFERDGVRDDGQPPTGTVNDSVDRVAEALLRARCAGAGERHFERDDQKITYTPDDIAEPTSGS